MRLKKFLIAAGLVLSLAIPASSEVWPTPCTPLNPVNCSRGTWGQEIRDFMDNTFDLLTAKIVSFFADVDTIHKYTTFEAAVAALCPTGDTSPEKTLIIPVVTTVAANTTVCKPLTLEFTGKGSLEPIVSVTVTVNGPVISAKPLADITGGAGTVTFGTQLLNMPSGNSSGDVAGIVDGTIVDADINASAAISDTKLATISTADKVRDSALSGRDSVLNYTDFATAVSTIGSNVKTLIIPSLQTVASNVTVPSTLTLEFIGTGQLNVGSATLSTLTSTEYGTLAFTTTTIDRTTGSWITDGYNVADATITITGSTSNNVTCGVASATALILTVDADCTLVTEAASTAETVNGQDPWTVTINGPLEAPLRQCFGGAGTIVLGDLVGIRYPQWDGAVGDGVADDTVAIQETADRGGIIDFNNLTYRIARNIGTNDRWGVKLTVDGTTFRNGTFRRFDTDISTFALAYPILLIGVPDSDVAASTDNVTIDNIHFIGEDTRHTTSGSALHDRRGAIDVKNTTEFIVKNSRFSKVDSSSIWFQKPDDFDEANVINYNTTKNYRAQIVNNKFLAEAHTTVGRALIHTIVSVGVDFLTVSENYFEWCDVAIADGTTYDDLEDVETDTYTGTVGVVKRSGRNRVFSGNIIYNASEHAMYANGMDAVITGNTFRTDHATVIGETAIKITGGRQVTVSKNVMSGMKVGVNVRESAFNISISGNSITTRGTGTAGAINISADGITTFVDNRAFLSTYYPTHNISIAGNSIFLREAAHSGSQGVGIRLVSTQGTDANFPDDDELYGVNVVGNTVKNARSSVFIFGAISKELNISGNTFLAKPFTDVGFNAGTTLNTEAAVMFDKLSTVGLHTSFNGNRVDGATNLFSTNDGLGTNVHIPKTIMGNVLSNIKNFKTSDMRDPDPAINVVRDNHTRQGYLTTYYPGIVRQTAIVAGDFALSAGWGSTASVSVVSGSNDRRGEFTVTSAGTGQTANPTITLTFKDGSYAVTPFMGVVRNGGSQLSVTHDWVESATTLVITWRGTPVAAETYTFSFRKTE